MRLTIVIPALNEEQAIASIIERTLAAREHIVSHSPVTGVDVVVVSDGSTDGTVDAGDTIDAPPGVWSALAPLPVNTASW